MKYIHSLYIGLLSLLFIGCTDEIENSGFGQGEGRLVLSGIKLEAVVGEVTTKAALEEDILPEITDFTIEIVDSEGSLVKTLEPGTLQCSLSTGSYKLKAIYGDAEAMSTTPAFYGETDFTIIEGGVSTPTITASLNQAVLHPIVAEELVAQFKDYKLTIKQTEGEAVDMVNDEDFFIPGDGTYTLTLSGVNQLGESFSHDWQYGNLAVRTRYTVECNPDLPSFTMPEQPEGNVWSKFIYITPMTADNMTSHSEMAQKVIDNAVYEASTDGTIWISSEKTNDGKIIIKGLEPSKSYILRSRFGAVYSNNEVEVTTESAQQIENGDMESWSETEVFGGAGALWCTAISCNYCSGWATRNEKTVSGAENANGTDNYGLYWRWCSGTVPTDDKLTGNTAAEISTLAFYNNQFSGFVGSIFDNKREYVYTKRVNSSGTAYVGYLFTGSFDKNSDSYTLGINHESRPTNISFGYKYAPMPTSDQCIVYAKVYDSEHQEIASTPTFNSTEQTDYKTEVLTFTYTSLTKKASYIGIFFQSGTNTNIANMKQIEGDYNSTPWKRDRVVGSVLKIDNVTLNYDYE